MRDVLVHLPSYPKTITADQLCGALDFSELVGGHVTGLISGPILDFPFAGLYPAYILRDIEDVQKIIRQTALAQKEAFEEACRRRGLEYEGRVIDLPASEVGQAVAEFARMKNLTIIPYLTEDSPWEEIAQAIIFEAGRPVLVLPAAARSFRAEEIVVAWDFSRAASRAVSDAMPLLRLAKKVRAVIVKSEKWLPVNLSGVELAAHLARNGVSVDLEEVELATRTIGQALDDAAAQADLLVMGAFGHTRVRDFFLGGATRHVLRNPKIPIFLSH